MYKKPASQERLPTNKDPEQNYASVGNVTLRNK